MRENELLVHAGKSLRLHTLTMQFVKSHLVTEAIEAGSLGLGLGDDATMLFHIRAARKDDAPALARLHVQAFNETHCGGRADGPSFELREHQWREAFTVNDGSWFCFVVEDDKGMSVGFAQGTPHDGGVPGFVGELNKIYVLRRFHRRGIGRLLLRHVARRFIERGVTSMLLFGEATNPSNGFYEAFGAERLYSRSGEFHGGYGWRDLHKLVAQCSGAQHDDTVAS
jgi:ribosomal protein S18 acetylase RimI-like enzyme